MSGGSYDYFYQRINDFASDIRIDSCCTDYVNPNLRKTFKAHLLLVAKAARAIEWNDSGDGDNEEIALLEQICPLSKQMGIAIEDAKKASEQLKALIKKAESV